MFDLNGSGIYQIKNMFNNKIYIGSAVNLRKRKNVHISSLRNNKHHNDYLQNSWNKYGEHCFIFEVLENVEDKKNLIAIEQMYLDTNNPEYNISKLAVSTLGTKRTTESKKRLSNSKLGEKNHMYGKIGKLHHNYGKWMSKETKKKMSVARIGKYVGKNSPNYGIKRDIVYKQKMRIKKLGYSWGNHSDETKQKLRSLKLGVKLTEEHKNKLSVTHKGLFTYEKHPGAKKVLQYSTDGEFIREWVCIKLAADTLNMGHSHISSVCRNKRKTCGGFIWKYKEEDNG